MTNTRPCRKTALVDAHFRGRLSRRGERAMRAHVAVCPDCRAHYEALRLVAAIDPAEPAARRRLSRALGLGPQTSRAPAVAFAGGLVAALTLLVCLVAVPGSSFTSRGEAEAPGSSVRAYRVTANGNAAPLAAEMNRDDELAFAYENGSGYARLLIFAVDAERRVYWYHPAWLTRDESPAAVDISKSRELVELEEAVAHGLREGSLWLYSVFTNEVLDVHAVEAMVDATPVTGGRLPVEGAQDVRLVRVRRDGGAP